MVPATLVALPAFIGLCMQLKMAYCKDQGAVASTLSADRPIALVPRLDIGGKLRFLRIEVPRMIKDTAITEDTSTTI